MRSPSRLAKALSTLLCTPGLLVSAVIRDRSKSEWGRQSLDVYDAANSLLYAAEHVSPPLPLAIVSSQTRRHSRVANASWRDHTSHGQRLESLEPVLQSSQLANITWDDQLLYDFLADLMERFAAHKVPASLSWGSLLGSRRHHSIIPWDHQDADLWVFSTNHTLITSMLDEQHTRYPKSSWHNKSFGYHIQISRTERRYVDLWLFEETAAGSVQCTGHRGSCAEWFSWCKRKKCDTYGGKPYGTPPTYLLSDVFPLVVRPFGPYLLPAPRRPDVILAEDYGKSWRSTCPAPGFSKFHQVSPCMNTNFGPLPCRKGLGCRQFYEWYPFVFDEPDGTEALRINSTHGKHGVLQRFNQSLEHPPRRPCVWRGIAEIYCHPSHGRRSNQWPRGRPAAGTPARKFRSKRHRAPRLDYWGHPLDYAMATRLDVSDDVLVETRDQG